MNGVAEPAPAAAPAAAPAGDDRLARKRALEQDLALVRSQKADVLRAIQQLAKKQKTGALQNTIMTAEMRLQAEGSEHRRNVASIFQQCGRLISELLKNQKTKMYFGEPVQRSFAPNYYDVIKQPMDLGTIKSKLERRQYTDPMQMRDDARLVFANCRQYNPPGNFIRAIGDAASDQFERKWLQAAIEGQWASELRRHALMGERLEAEARSLPDRMAAVDAELAELTAAAEARAAPPAPPGGGREMTFEEKRRLSMALGALPGEKLARVLEIVAEGPSAPQEVDNDDEVELDIDAFDTGTLWRLHAYVEAALADLDAKAAPTGAAATAGATAPPSAAPSGAAAGTGTGTGGRMGDKGGASESEEGVGSKGAETSQGAEKKAPGGHDLTTFVSATGPGAAQQTQILKNTAQKKDVQLQNAGAWDSLKAEAVPPAAAAAGGGAPAPAEEDDLWNEFQGREAQQQAAEAAKRRAEEEARAAREAGAAAAAAAAAEAAAKAAAEAAAAAAAERAAKEARRAADRAALETMGRAAAAAAAPEALRHAGHESAADLAQLGLAARGDEDDDDAGDGGDGDDMEEV